MTRFANLLMIVGPLCLLSAAVHVSLSDIGKWDLSGLLAGCGLFLLGIGIRACFNFETQPRKTLNVAGAHLDARAQGWKGGISGTISK